MKKFRTQESLFSYGDPNEDEDLDLTVYEKRSDSHVNRNCDSKAMSLKLVELVKETPPEVNSPKIKTPDQHGTFFQHHVLSTTPPTGKRTASAGSTYKDDNFSLVKKKKKGFPRSLKDRNGIPHVSQRLNERFLEFIHNEENWNQVFLDTNDVQNGNGRLTYRSILQKERKIEVCVENLKNENAVTAAQHSESPITTGIRKQLSSISLKPSVDKPRLVKDVPRFYWPEGKPPPNSIIQESLSKAEDKFKQYSNGGVAFSQFGELLQAVGVPLYWKKPLWMALSLSPEDSCSSKIFIPFLRYLLCECQDDASRFARIISSAVKNFPEGSNGVVNNNKRTSKYYVNHGEFCQDLKAVEISMSDFIPMVQDIIDTHPGLGFLREAPEFHSRYVTTVISRMFYKVNRSWSGRLTLSELRRSNLLRVIKRLEEETDINSITEYFSYEHFYVIYCKFWELDKDHDLLIDKRDLAAHADHALSSRIIDRIFSGTVLRGWDVTSPIRASNDKMTYSDFVWFLLSEEDKKTHTAIEYWFRCLDLDGDGILSPYELQYFYSEQESRIESLGIEPLHFSNVYCQIVDMLHCSTTGIRLRDLKHNSFLAANVFNTLFNLDKYLENEQKDPFAAAASLGNAESSEGETDWDKYATAEYELLIAEESPSDHLHNSDLEETMSP